MTGAQEFLMFDDDGAIKTDRVFEEKIEALAIAEKVTWTLRSPARIKVWDANAT